MTRLPGLASATVLIDTDFGKADTPVVSGQGKPNERVTGVLPEGWQDNSDWAQAWAKLSVGEEQGYRFLRVNCTRLDDGRIQLVFSQLPKIEGEASFRLSVRLRNTDIPVEIGLRMQGAPYQFYWSTIIRTGGWRTERFEFTLRKADGRDAGFFVNLANVGAVDIESLKLERLTRRDIEAEVKAEFPDRGPANLFRHSRFPLGMPCGWALGRDTSDGDEVAVSVGGRPGPSGVPPLKFVAKKPGRIFTEPFSVVYPIAPHRAAFSVRGTGEWEFSVVWNVWNSLGSKKAILNGGTEWERVIIDFSPGLFTPACAIKIEGEGELYLDALQAGPADKVGEYTPAGACEVALALPERDGWEARVQFEDDPAIVFFAVTGGPAEAVLRAKVVNVRGEEKELRPVRLAGRFFSRGRLKYDAFGDSCRRGTFRIEAWVEREGKRISPVGETVIHRFRRPRYWGKDAPNSPFGVHCNSTTRHNVMIKAIGVNWVRLHDAGMEYVGWRWLEPEPGKWEFRDAEIDRYRRHKIMICGELGTAPKWASYLNGVDTGREYIGYFDNYFQPRDLADYANYVKTVVSRYRGRIRAWDIWNEPWISSWWAVDYDKENDRYITSKEPDRDFVAMMRTAYRAAKAVAPEINILGFNTTAEGGWPDTFLGEDWTAGVLRNGGMDFCDTVVYHQYTEEFAAHPGDSVERGYAAALGPILDRYGSCPKPVWMTEGNSVNRLLDNGMYKHTVPYPANDDNVDAGNRLCRHVLSLLAQKVDKAFLYSMHSHWHFSSEPPMWRTLVTAEGYLHPCGAALANLTWHLEDTEFIKTVEIAEGAHAFLFEGKGRAVAVLAVRDKPVNYVIPVGSRLEVSDLFGNPLPGKAKLGREPVYLMARRLADLERLLPPIGGGKANSAGN